MVNSEIRASQVSRRKATRPDLLSPLVMVHRIPHQGLATAADWREKVYPCCVDPQSHRLDLLLRHFLRNENCNSKRRDMQGGRFRTPGFYGGCHHAQNLVEPAEHLGQSFHK